MLGIVRSPRGILRAIGIVAALICAQFVTATRLTADDADESKALPPTLTECQTAQAHGLQLEAENEGLRRAVLALQLQLEQIRGSQSLQQREREWNALEQALGCRLDRQTLQCASAQARQPATGGTDK